MLSFTSLVSGGQVAAEIANDDEEFAEMLKGLAGYEASQFQDLPNYLDEQECADIATLLRGLADIVER